MHDLKQYEIFKGEINIIIVFGSIVGVIFRLQHIMPIILSTIYAIRQCSLKFQIMLTIFNNYAPIMLSRKEKPRY